ncbi:concanavalin A-like lectin/glucanase domain-containing protein, partial [Staphylotrichum tortipilum]
APYGGLAGMGQALGRGMVLAFSIWNDAGGNMNWLDSGSNGPCSSTEGNPSNILANSPDTRVIFSNIRWGDIGSTAQVSGGGSSSSASSTFRTSTTSSASTKSLSTTGTSSSTRTTTLSSTSTTTSINLHTTGAAQTHWGQCGGQGWPGPYSCQAPYACATQNPWYAQCL